MNYLKYIILFSLILSPFTSKSYSLTNSWCSNGKYSKAISPFPKSHFKYCPGFANKIMTTKEVENYYMNGLGKDYLCKLAANPLFFSSRHKREDYEALKQLFKSKQVNVGLMCAQLNQDNLVEKKTEVHVDEKPTSSNVNKKTKEWCIGAGKYGKQYPIKKKGACPTHSLIEITSEEAAQKLLSGSGKNYLTNLITSGAICQNDNTDYKFIRELLKGKKDLGCLKQMTLAEKKAEEKARIRVLAEKLAKKEIARQLRIKQKEEEETKQKALAKKRAEKLAKQKAIAAKKAKEDKARKKALAKEKAEELAKQKAIAAKKVEDEELKQKVLNEKIQKIKDEAKFVVVTLKEYVTTDTNKLDILEVSELLENYNTEMQKGWSDTTIKKYEELYDYVQKDEGFIEFSADKKSKQLAAYNEEIIQLREYLTTSQSDLKAFITKNLGSNNTKKALKLAKETKQLLKDFEVSQAMTLKNNIATWKAMNGVKEDKKYTFKLLNKKVAEKKHRITKKITQNKFSSNITNKKKAKSQTKKDLSFTNVIFENKWQHSQYYKCSSGTYKIYDKKYGNVFVLRGEKKIAPNQDVKITKIDSDKIRIETKIFSSNKFKKMMGGKSFLIMSITEVITVLKGNQILAKQTIKGLDITRLMKNSWDKVYETTQNSFRSVSCGLLSSKQKSNKTSTATSTPAKRKAEEKARLEKPFIKLPSSCNEQHLNIAYTVWKDKFSPHKESTARMMKSCSSAYGLETIFMGEGIGTVIQQYGRWIVFFVRGVFSTNAVCYDRTGAVRPKKVPNDNRLTISQLCR